MGIFGSGDNQARYSGELHNLKLTQSVYGTTIPIIIGTRRISPKLLFYGGFYRTQVEQSGGKGLFGGKGGTEYNYYADTEAALCAGAYTATPSGILNIWDNSGKLENQSGQISTTLSTTSYSQVINPVIGCELGVSYSHNYTHTVTDYGSGQTRTISGTMQVPMKRVSGSPAQGQYSYSYNSSTKASTWTFNASDVGKAVTMNYSSVWSLYYRSQTQAAQVPANAPYQISTDNQQYFYADQGVVNINGTALVRGASTNGYTESDGIYTFTHDLAGAYIYINYEFTSSDSTISNSATLNLTFFNGAIGQAPWSFMQSKFPGSAFGYPGISYFGANPMAMGTEGTFPQYNFEIVGLVPFGGGNLDAHPCDGLELLLTDPFLGCDFPPAMIGDWSSAYAYWASNNYFMSLLLDTQVSISEAMRNVIEVGNVGAVFSGGLLKLIPYGDETTVGNGYVYTPNTTPAAILTDNDLILPDVKPGQTTQTERLLVSIKAAQDCTNYTQAQWCNRENDYNNELISEQEDSYIALYTRRIETAQTWDWITTRNAAIWALDIHLKRECYILNNYTFYLPFRFSALEPMDMVQLPTGENVRITQITDSGDTGALTVEAEQWSYGTAAATLYSKQAPSSYQPTQSNDLPGETYPVLFETPPLGSTTQLNEVQIAAVGNNTSWGGCKVYVSTDGEDFVYVGPNITSSGKTGFLTAALPSSSSNPDTTSTLSVDMTISSAELIGTTQANADSFTTLSAIVDPDGSIELVSYETANLTSAYHYNLTYLRRGVYGTTVKAHAIGSRFCFIGISGVFEYPFAVQYIAKPLYFKFASFNLLGNQNEDLSQCQVYTYAPAGTAYPSPPIVTITQSATQPSGSTTSTSSDAVTVTSSGGVTTATKVWLTIEWTWESNYPTPLNFQVVAFTGSDPTVTANYLFDITTVVSSARSLIVSVTPTATISGVNAAVRAIYA
jgi:hypothetical protein